MIGACKQKEENKGEGDNFMTKKFSMKKLVSCVLTLALLAGLIVHFQPTYADPEEREVKISNVKLTKWNGEIPALGFETWDSLKLTLDWDASDYGNTLKEGDFFVVDFPKELKFDENNPGSLTFDLFAPGGTEVMAKGVIILSKPNTGGATVKVTFTNWVENKLDVKGTINSSLRFNTEIVKNGETKVITFAIGNFKVTHEFKTAEYIPKPLPDEKRKLEKWSYGTVSKLGNARWFMRINNGKHSYDNLQMSDELSSTDGNMSGIHFVKETFELWEVVENEFGTETDQSKRIVKKYDQLKDDLVFENNDSKFTYNFGKVDGKQYRLYYESTFRPNVQLSNKATLIGGQDPIVRHSGVLIQSTGGTGQGTLASKIQILKRDALDNSPLQGAEFEITKIKDNSKFTITSDDKGQATTGKLEPGKYKVVETKAPAGYELKTQEIELDVKADAPATYTFTNEPVKTELTVKKEWVGAQAAEAEVALKADDVEVQTFKLTAADGWSKTITDLRKYKKGTEEEIKYTVEEKNIAGYTAEYSVDKTGILVIKNTQKVNVPVKKVWEMLPGNAAPVESIEVELLKDATATGQKLELKSAEAWQNEFKDLAMESPTTAFSVKEVGEADGKLKLGNKVFEVKYDGDMKAGYTITNKELPAPSPDGGDKEKTRDSTTSIVTTPKEDESSTPEKPKEDVTDLKDGSVPKTDIPNTEKPNTDQSGTEQPKQDPTQELNADGTPKGNTTPENNASTPKTDTNSAVTAKKLPQTGDGVDPMVYAGLAFLMGTALIAFGIRRKMKDEK